MIMRRQNKLPEAEQFLKQALAIREEKLVRLSPVGIAYTLVQLATIEELRGKCDGEVEQRLMRALEIFGRVKGKLTHRCIVSTSIDRPTVDRFHASLYIEGMFVWTHLYHTCVLLLHCRSEQSGSAEHP